MEHVVLSNLASHLCDLGILVRNQHGFRSGLSCETQLVEAIHDWTSVLDVTGQVDMVLLDFSKAFDKVPHQRLLYKLDFYGIRGKNYQWIKSFLTDRRQRCVVNGTASDWCSVTSGVPQGSVLGPALFLIFINDIIDNISSEVRLFADDTVIYRSINSDADHKILQNDLNTLFNWSATWQMSFNVQKCFVLSVTRRTKHKSYFEYSMGGQALPIISSSKYLGVVLSDSMKWSEHVNNITTSSRQTLGMLQRNLSNCSQNVRKTAYETLVRPKLEYSSPAWNPYLDKDVTKLESVQRRAARFVFKNYSQFASVTPMISDLGWDSLEIRRTMSSLVLFFKIHHSLVNIDFPNCVTPKRFTRSTSFLLVCPANSLAHLELSSNYVRPGNSPSQCPL